MTQPGDDRRGLAWGAALAAVVLGALWPWVGRLGTVPVTTDGALWVGRSALGAEGWWRWDFLSSHFIGYRPLTALTFTLDSALSGLDPLAYRLTDLGLHAGVLVMVWVLFRALAPERPRWAALLAVAIVALHPGVQEAVPMLARRSYLLGSLLGAASVWTLIREVRRERVPWRSALLLLAAMLSNESAYALVGVLPVVSWHVSRTRRWRAHLAWLGGPALALAAAVALRLGITGQVGGYGSMGPSPGRSADVAGLAASYLLFPHSATDEPAVVLAGMVGMGAVSIWLVWGGLVRPWLHWREAASRLPAVLVVWGVAHVGLYMLTGRWYVREAYPVLVPLGLLVGVLVADLARVHPGRLAAEGLAAGILAVAMLSHSPVLWGPDPVRTRDAALYQAQVDSLLRHLDALQGPARVWLVVPVAPAHRPSKQGRRVVRYQAQRLSSWATIALGRDDVEVRDALYLMDPRSPWLEETGVALPVGAAIKVPRGVRHPGPVLELADLPEAGADVEVLAVYFEGTEAIPVRLTAPGGPSQSGDHGHGAGGSR